MPVQTSPHCWQDLNMDFEIITPSRESDFERCQLLCQTIDRFVKGSFRHIIVVDHSDYELFKPLRNSVRDVIEIESLLPWWIRPTHLSFGRYQRRLWVGWRCLPIHGWLAQQLAKIAVVHSMESNIAVFADSDIFFVRPFDVSHITKDSKVRLERVPEAIDSGKIGHRDWCATAARLLSVSPPIFPAPDYVGNVITWTRPNAVALCKRIEATTGRHWVAAIANQGRNRFSEYMTYGTFVERVLQGDSKHYFDDSRLCHSYWGYESLRKESLESFVDSLQKDQVAIGIQSTSQTPIQVLRDYLAKST
jgi:uncharacterized protein DUF6492